MKLGLKDKVAIVTGASHGLGKAIAVALAQEGCRVVLSARGEPELEQVANSIRQTGGIAEPIAADATHFQAMQSLVERTIATFGAIHILVNNTGTLRKTTAFEQISDEEWLEVFKINLFSTVQLVRAALPHMQQQKWGRIINLASESGIQPDPTMPHYNASKAALINLTKSLSKAYAKDGILVNAVSPAFIDTPMVDEMLEKQAKSKGITEQQAEAEFLHENRPNLVLERAGKPEEVAAVVVFLASEATSFVTGSNYRVDGGSVASIN